MKFNLKNLKDYLYKEATEAYKGANQGDETAEYEIDLLESIITKVENFEKELRRKMEECTKDMKHSSIRMGLIGEYSLIKEILGEEVSHNSN